jgi:hypothetical protein
LAAARLVLIFGICFLLEQKNKSFGKILMYLRTAHLAAGSIKSHISKTDGVNEKPAFTPA